MSFPRIETIHDVLPYLDDNFRVSTQGDYTYINYKLMGDETFPPYVVTQDMESTELNFKSDTRRECRGIAFEVSTGRIVSRPFHKFFNLGERPNEEPEGYHTVYEKLDGSMIRPLPNGRLATKAGVTDVAMQAEKFVAETLGDKFITRCSDFTDCYITPIFEFISPDNKIVLHYDKPQLVLLAARFNMTGRYVGYDTLKTYAMILGVPVVQQSTFKPDSTVDEGVVMVYNGGERVKVKTDWYVKAHKGKELIRNHRNLIKLWLDNDLDDILPTLLPEDRKRVDDYVVKLSNFIKSKAKTLKDVADGVTDRKQFALHTKLPPKDKAAVFTIMNGKLTPQEAVIKSHVRYSLRDLKRFADFEKGL